MKKSSGYRVLVVVEFEAHAIMNLIIFQSDMVLEDAVPLFCEDSPRCQISGLSNDAFVLLLLPLVLVLLHIPPPAPPPLSLSTKLARACMQETHEA